MEEKILISSLRNLADKIENGEAEPYLKQRAGELFMESEFRRLEDIEELSERDISKFICLGWYVYYVLLKDKIKIEN